MSSRKLTGNEAVDAMAAMAVTGNVIPATWYKTITTPSGKADLVAINILSDVLYWYRPREVRDEYTGDIVAYQKRFAADYLQRSYEQLSEHFGILTFAVEEARFPSLTWENELFLLTFFCSDWESAALPARAPP